MLDLGAMFLLHLGLNAPQGAEEAQAFLLGFGQLRRIGLHGHIDLVQIHS